uniref:Chorion protein E1 n=1 Tax=Antheraea polyphemus TaxID=7120 RepID=CHE1_ANTPO|nr:RecName: Full=Chorion protein E1; Flags: Precursor [Antheraea polyphemus]AAB59217.1 filler protein [Antheraea polyphemus]
MAWFTTVLIVASLLGSLVAQPITYTLVPTSSIPSQPTTSNERNKSCRLAIEELGALVQLLKELSSDESSGARLSEDVIVKLVNALIYVATYTCKGTGYNTTPLDILCDGVCGVGAGRGAEMEGKPRSGAGKGAEMEGKPKSTESVAETNTVAAGTGVVAEKTGTESSAS